MPYLNDSFDWRRVYLLGRQIIWMNHQHILIALACWTCAYLFFGILLGGHSVASITLYFLALFTGWIHTSGIFSDYHDRLSAPATLMLPASSTEKAAARWLLTGVVYPLGVMLIASLLHQADYLSNTHPSWYFTVNGQPEDLDPIGWTLLPVGGKDLPLAYLAGHAAFFWGAIRFERHSLAMTVLAICGLSVIVLIASLLVHNLSFISNESAAGTAVAHGIREVYRLGKPVFWYIAAPVFLLLSYLNIRRAEA